MNNNVIKSQCPSYTPSFADFDAGKECLGQTISMIRAFAVAPEMFDRMCASDRQNMFLIVLRHAESAQAYFSRQK